MGTIRVMLVHNNAEQAEVLAAAFDKHTDIEIAAIASTREAAIKQLTTSCDVVILDPEVLKQRTLSRFLRAVNLKAGNVRTILILDKAPTDEYLISNIKAGVRGHIKTTDPVAVMAKAVRAVHSGEIWAERRLLEKALSKPLILPETLLTHVPGVQPLTNREREMLSMLLQGATNKEIAEKSSISERTVKTHLYRIYKKLKVKSRTKAIALLAQS